MTRTETEQLVRIKTLLEEKVLGELVELREEVKAIREDDIAAIRRELEGEQRARAALENKGKGAFAVLSVLFTALGAFVTLTWDKLVSLFH